MRPAPGARPSKARLLTSGHIVAKVIRFGLVGLLSGTIYAVVTVASISWFDVSPIPASIAGYCVSVPASFLGHREFSFRSGGRWTIEAVRFATAQAGNIAVTAGSMYAALRLLGPHYGWGIVIAVILVPIANFLFMNLWVFADQPGRGRR